MKKVFPSQKESDSFHNTMNLFMNQVPLANVTLINLV